MSCRCCQGQASSGEGFELTYATMFNPPEEMHQRFESAVAQLKANLGQEYGLFIAGKEIKTSRKIEDRNPADTRQVLALVQEGDAGHASQAVEAALKAFPAWSAKPWTERVAILRKVARLIRERLFVISAANAMSVGKNRMEAMGDVNEAPVLIDFACDRMEENHGFIRELPKDPLAGCRPYNRSTMRPHGAWLVVAPFNFPTALTAGPAGAALATGNTVVVKCSSDTPWSARLIIECFWEAGVPEGAINFLTGPGGTLGQALIADRRLAGATFTGSLDVGMHLYREFAKSQYVRPVVLELGGKNPTLVSKRADLDMAALGIMRSAFGFQGQKCSANSRVYVERPVYQDLVDRLVKLANGLAMGDPLRREVYLGPVVNRKAYESFQGYCRELAGHIATGGTTPTDGALAHGYFCAPTVAAGVPLDHRLWKHEMFVPITMVAPVDRLEEGMALATDTIYGLTSGFYGADDEAQWFFDRAQSGVAYVNRVTGSTTGAWPGYQPFGGWKASGATGRNSGGAYYLLSYLREQVWSQILPE